MDNYRKILCLNQYIVYCLLFFATLLHILNLPLPNCICSIWQKLQNEAKKKHPTERDKSPIEEIKLANRWNLAFDGQIDIDKKYNIW